MASILIEPDICRVVADAIKAIPVTASQIRGATSHDPLLQQVIRFHISKWPVQKIEDSYLKQFHQRLNSLSIIDGYLLVAERVVVPMELHPKVLMQFHTGHS